MHPILRQTRHLATYLAAWILFGALLTVALTGRSGWAGPLASGEVSTVAALLLLLPISVAYGFICLSAWYPCRAHPLGEASGARLLGVHLVGALVSTVLWQLLTFGWATTLERFAAGSGAVSLHRENLPVFVATGVLLYLLTVTAHYLLLASEASRRAARESLELELLARQAELEAFKAQIDPHFLFNCLNSISSLCGSDPDAARQTTLRLAEFLRSSLELGSRDLIPLERELELVSAYLDVERARFGDRLELERTVDPEGLEHPVPALLLQPLLENALKHGVAHRVESTRVELRGWRVGGRLRLAVTNACDPDRPRRSGTGIGLANVRGRLELLYGDDAIVEVRDRGDRFEVEIDLPPAPAAGEAA